MMTVVMLAPRRVMEDHLAVAIRIGRATLRDWQYFMDQVLEALWFEEPTDYGRLKEIAELGSNLSVVAGFCQAVTELVEDFSKYYGNSYDEAVDTFAVLEAEAWSLGSTEPELARLRAATTRLAAGVIYGQGSLQLVRRLMSAFADKLPADTKEPLSRADGYRLALSLLLVTLHDRLARRANPDYASLIRNALQQIGVRGVSEEDFVRYLMTVYGANQATAENWLIWLREGWLVYLAEDDRAAAYQAAGSDLPLRVYVAPRYLPPAIPAKGVTAVAAAA